MARVNDATWEFSPWGELTPEIVEGLTEDARKGFPFDARAQFVGKPAYEAREPLQPRISFRVPPEVLAAAQKRADEEQRSLSELAAEALREHLARPPRSVAVREKSDDS